MTDFAPVARIDVPEALWRVAVMQEIESNGGTLDDRQVEVLMHALAVIAADSPVRNATPADNGALPAFGRGNGNGRPAVKYVTMKQLPHLVREIARRDVTTIATTTVAEMLARCERTGTDPLTVIPRKLASEALDILFNAPFKARPNVAPAATASSMANHRLYASEPAEETPWWDPDGNTAGYDVPASEPAAERPAAPVRNDGPAVTEEGSYRVGDAVYRVRRSKSSGRLYAELLNADTGKFEYAKGEIFRITPEDRMTVADAERYGRAIGRCVVCGRTLTAKASVERSIGPVCITRV